MIWFFINIFLERDKKINMFTSKFNTMTGTLDWEIQSEDYDYQQELARAGFADMLHDSERVNLTSSNSNLKIV